MFDQTLTSLFETFRFKSEGSKMPVQRKTVAKKPLILSKSQYNAMWSHLNRDKKKEEVTKQEEEYREYLRRTSQEMTKNWENSIENTRIKKGKEKEAIRAVAAVQGRFSAFQMIFF